jgi:hypothetical protein
MKRLLSTALAVALLLGLGALAVLARPKGAGTPLAASAARSASALAAPNVQSDTSDPVTQTELSGTAPEAPAVSNSWNNIALPLDAQKQFADLGLSYDASGLASFIGRSSVAEVRVWDAVSQSYLKCQVTTTGCYGTPNPFPLATSRNYMVLFKGASSAVVSFVGDVPASGSVFFALEGITPGCSWNAISLPLDQSSVTDASKFADALGRADVKEIRSWDAASQSYLKCQVTTTGCYGTSTPFPTQIGYPYWVCMKTPKNWP